MTVPAPAVVSFRDADEPAPLAGRIVAAASSHPRGWSLLIPDVGATEHTTLDAAAYTVIERTGLNHLLMVWTTREAS